MTDKVTNELLLEMMKALPTRFDKLEHIVREQGAAAAEERPRLRALMQTTGRHEDSFATLDARLDRIGRCLDLTS